MNEFGAFHSMPKARGQIKNRVRDTGDSDGEEIHCREPNSTTANPTLTVLRHSSSRGEKLSCFPEHLFPVRKNVAFSHLMLVLGEIYSYAMKIITSQILPHCLFILLLVLYWTPFLWQLLICFLSL